MAASLRECGHFLSCAAATVSNWESPVKYQNLWSKESTITIQGNAMWRAGAIFVFKFKKEGKLSLV
ncbi:MAG: hypothetical protein OSA93_01355 [Akkermansiaceae bacterium]|nr:hypothetical protein [Akkermansiaceae bacterium]